MPTTTVNGLRFFFVDEGHGTPVVLLHGFPDTSFLWRHQIPALVRAGFRIIAPDLRGRGQSDKPERVEDYRLSAMMKDVAGIMDALGIERYIEDLSEPGALTAALNWYRANVPPERFIKPPSRMPAVQAPTLGIFSTGD